MSQPKTLKRLKNQLPKMAKYIFFWRKLTLRFPQLIEHLNLLK